MFAQGPPAEPMAFLAGLLVCVIAFLIALLVVQIFFLLTLYRTLSAVDERNREMQPGMVFLILIPLFGAIWAILTVGRISRSLEREFDDRGWNKGLEGFGRIQGSIWAWGGLANLLLSAVQNVLQLAVDPFIAMFVSLVSLPLGIAVLVFWIIYWVQMAQYGRRLREGGRGYAPGGVEEDYDDYSAPRRDDEEYDRYERRDDRDR